MFEGGTRFRESSCMIQMPNPGFQPRFRSIQLSCDPDFSRQTSTSSFEPSEKFESLQPSEQITLFADELPPTPTSCVFREQAQKETDTKISGWLLCRESSAAGSWTVARGPLARLFWKRRHVRLQEGKLQLWKCDKEQQKQKVLTAVPLVELKEVAHDGEVVCLYFSTLRWPLQMRGESEGEAARWAAEIKSAAGHALSPNLPDGWNVKAMLSRSSSAKLVHKETLEQDALPWLQQLLDHCCVSKTTKDRRGKPVPFRFELLEAVRVQNGSAWMAYSKARDRVAKGAPRNASEPLHFGTFLNEDSATGCDSPVLPDTSSADFSLTDSSPHEGSGARYLGGAPLTSTLQEEKLHDWLGDLDVTANEQWLFHGTSAAAVQGISDEEFRLDFAGTHRGSLFGKAIYLAESTTKADEYSTEDEDGCCWMLLCRAALGRMLTCCDLRPPKDILERCQALGFDSLLGDRQAAVGTFREFVIPEASQVYPAFILRYRRWNEATFCQTIRKTVESKNNRAAEILIPHAAVLAGEHSDYKVCCRLYHVLAAYADVAVPVLSKMLSQSPDDRVREHCALALMELAVFVAGCEGKTPAVINAIPQLESSLSDSNAKVRRACSQALQAIGGYATASSVRPLMRALKDEDEEVRASAARALGQLGYAAGEALPELLKSTKAAAESVRVAAVEALGNFKTSWQSQCIANEDIYGTSQRLLLQALQERLLDASADVRVAAASSMGQHLSTGSAVPGAVASLSMRLSDKEAGVRSAAAQALGLIGGHRAVPALDAMAACLKDENPDVRRAIATSLGQVGHFANCVAPSLVLSMSDTCPAVREASAKALSRVWGREAEVDAQTITALVKYGVSDSAVEVRIVSVEALADFARMSQLGPFVDLVLRAMANRMKDVMPVRKAALACRQAVLSAQSCDREEDSDGDDVSL
eukprot:TRINITY_DN33108_c0_g1_i1.p1 TRINITY_DN33108_c0_g1~~TRINITY_DN33108_c0_g1_i1.p1  ORF type:complete len:930 (-),score=147.96 TRINITY_DN33108_c0_g1_i1:32-2821(-)